MSRSSPETNSYTGAFTNDSRDSPDPRANFRTDASWAAGTHDRSFRNASDSGDKDSRNRDTSRNGKPRTASGVPEQDGILDQPNHPVTLTIRNTSNNSGRRAPQKPSALPSIPEAPQPQDGSLSIGDAPESARRPEFFDIGSDTDISSPDYQSVESSDASNYRPASRGHVSPNPSSRSRSRNQSSDESNYRPASRGAVSPDPSSRSRSSPRLFARKRYRWIGCGFSKPQFAVQIRVSTCRRRCFRRRSF